MKLYSYYNVNLGKEEHIQAFYYDKDGVTLIPVLIQGIIDTGDWVDSAVTKCRILLADTTAFGLDLREIIGVVKNKVMLGPILNKTLSPKYHNGLSDASLVHSSKLRFEDTKDMISWLKKEEHINKKYITV